MSHYFFHSCVTHSKQSCSTIFVYSDVINRFLYDAKFKGYIDGLLPNCSISIALALGKLQPCTKPSLCGLVCRELVSECGASNYIPHVLWDVVTSPGCFSLTFRELSKIISRKYKILDITFMLRISSWNFVRMKFKLESPIRSTLFAIHKFPEIISESLRNVTETPPGLDTCFWTQVLTWHADILQQWLCKSVSAQDSVSQVWLSPYLGWLSSWWRHQMETFSALLALCAGNSPVRTKASDAEHWCFLSAVPE